MNTFFRFIFSKLFLKQLILAILIAAALLGVTVLGLRIYTRHGKTIQVPDIKGYNNAQVERIISESDLRYEIIDSVYSQEVLPGTVFDQIPKAGAFVKKNRKIFLIMNAVNSELVHVPSLKNVSLRQAQVLIAQNGLKLGNVTYVASEFKDLVLKQMMGDSIIAPGTMVPKGSKVNLLVGRGLSANTTEVPYLRGMYWIDAKATILSIKLNEGAIIKDESISEDAPLDSAFVWKQYPQPFVHANIGKSVDLWLTMDTAVVYAEDTTLRMK